MHMTLYTKKLYVVDIVHRFMTSKSPGRNSISTKWYMSRHGAPSLSYAKYSHTR
jgi:hypothetical protein